MKKSPILFLTFFVLLFNKSLSQNLSTKDSITNFYTSFMDGLETRYLHRAKVDWKEMKAYALKNALKTKSFKNSLETTVLVFDSIKCNHCKLFSETGFYGSTLNKQLSKGDFSEAYLLELQKKPPFEVRLINKSIGYINIPGMLMINLTKDSLNIETQRMYDKIAHLAKKNIVKGWIIDLRFNSGGNVYPMLASLHYLLGDNIMYNGLDNDGNITNIHRLKDGGFYTGQILEVKVKTSVKPNLKIPIALLIGKMTGSSGEDIAVAFKNRQKTTFIGEKTYGFLTGNDLVELPYNNKLALTVSYIADQNNIYRKFITPDIKVVKKDDFTNFMNDENIIQALKFIEKR